MALQPKWDARPPPARRTLSPKVITIPYGKFLPRVKINEKSGKRAYTELGSTHTEKKLANVGFSQCSYFVFTQRCFLAFLLNAIFCHWVRRTALQFGYCIINILVYINSVRGAMIHRYIDGA